MRSALLLAGAAAALGAGSLVGIGVAQAATTGPCDIYGSAGTPCVAAHSTTRALFATYNGPLYQVRRASDNATSNVGLLAVGDYANAATQDSFCANTSCIITIIYDQTSRHNDLTIEGAGGAGGADTGVPAAALPVTAGGHRVYGAFFSGMMGYRDNSTSGVAVGGQAEGMYMVTSGTHVNNRCCFDYGNAETNNRDNGNGHMDAINFGTECWFSPCSGSGPWVQADLENGLFQSNLGHSTNTSNTGNSAPFVTALLKNNGQNFFALKDGNAQSGGLNTRYSGALPTSPAGYTPMHLEGAIVLGTGGDNSNGSIGSFFEGVMTAGLPTDAADNSVQANIVSVGYAAASGGGQPGVRIVGGQSGRCVDINNSSTANGTQAQLWDCTGQSNQVWTTTASKQLMVYGSKCLDAFGRGTSNGTAVVIWDCNGGTNQQWNVNANGTVTGVQSGLCLDASSAGTANGTKIILWACNGGANQQWSLRS